MRKAEALILAVSLAIFLALLLLVSWPGAVCAESRETGGTRDAMNAGNHLTVNATLGDMRGYPAPAGFSRHLFFREPERYGMGVRLSNAGILLISTGTATTGGAVCRA